MPRTLVISSEVIAQEVAGETVLLDMNSEQYFSLDTVGTRIWQMLGQSMDIAEIREQLLQEYDVSEQQLARDVDELIAVLLEQGLVTVAGQRG